MKRFLLIILSIIMVFSLVGCRDKSQSILLATTTSTNDSGLLDYILPKFEEETGIRVKVISVGTGKALQMGRDGEADVLLVHAKESEEIFVEEGHGVERHEVMYNDFILVGPKDDPLKLRANHPNDINKGLEEIFKKQSTFISRGDDSGTHKKELQLWSNIGVEPKGDWYISAGSGMAEVLKITSEKQGYTLTDRATYLSHRSDLGLDIIIEKNEILFNQYGIIAVNPNKNRSINISGAQELIRWIKSEEGQRLIGEFGMDKYGMPLFVPNANK